MDKLHRSIRALLEKLRERNGHSHVSPSMEALALLKTTLQLNRGDYTISETRLSAEAT